MHGLIFADFAIFWQIMDKDIKYLGAAKIRPHKIIRILPSTKINPCEIWRNFHKKIISAKVSLPKVNDSFDINNF